MKVKLKDPWVDVVCFNDNITSISALCDLIDSHITLHKGGKGDKVLGVSFTDSITKKSYSADTWDYIVRDQHGKLHIMKPKEFHAMYAEEPIELYYNKMEEKK